MFKYKEEHSLQERAEEVSRIISKWPGRIPIIMEKSPTSHLLSLPKNRFLCPGGYSVHNFIGSLRRTINLPKDVALFVFINGHEIASGEASMKTIYDQKKDEDGFLYVMFSEQEVMG